MPGKEKFFFSAWAAHAYAASALRNMSEELAGLERKMRLRRIAPLRGSVNPYKDSMPPCIPGWNCKVSLDDAAKGLAELEETVRDAFALGRAVIAQARRERVLDFEMRLSGPVGPAPDRTGDVTGARQPKPKRKPKRPRPGRASPKRRTR